MSSQRFCLRWNNHQTNMLSVFDQLLHDGTFIDVTLAVEGQHLKAHKMVLSACSPYFQQLFVNHPEKHPIVILRDVPYKDMKCLLDFMYRGEVSVDQDRLAAFLRVAESLRIKGLTEVNDDKPAAPAVGGSGGGGGGGGSTTTSGSATASSASAASGVTQTTTASSVTAVPSATVAGGTVQTNNISVEDDEDDDRCSPAAPNSIPVSSANSTGHAAGGVASQLKSLPPLLSSSGIVTRSHRNSLLQQHHQSGNSGAMLQSVLSQQKRKRGRPRKLSGSDAGGEGGASGEPADGGCDGGGDEYDSNSMDIMDVKIASSGASNSGDDDHQLRIVSSRTEDNDSPMNDEDDEDEMVDDEDMMVEGDDMMEPGTNDDARGTTTPSLDESMDAGAAETTNNNTTTNRSGTGGRKHGALSKPTRASKRGKTASNNLRNHENSMSDVKFASYNSELTIFPIHLEKKREQYGNGVRTEHDEEEEDEEIEFIIPKSALAKLSIARDNTAMPLLQQLQWKGHLQELTITEQRQSTSRQNGTGCKESSQQSTPPPPTPAESMHDCEEASDLRVHPTTSDEPCGNETSERSLQADGEACPTKPSPKNLSVQKRRTRKTISPTDPAEALTEMSVRGLNLFRYATITAGTYQCLECAKADVQKTFKNKYSFQRHAFLYHEGKQRKVFPCPVCHKDFSRPDKMKNHLRMTHESNEAKSDGLLPNAAIPASGFLPPRSTVGELPTLHLVPPPQALVLPNLSMQHLPDEQRRRLQQQEHNVMKFRSIVNAIKLRQLQQLHQCQQQQPSPPPQQCGARDLSMRPEKVLQIVPEQRKEVPSLSKQLDAPQYVVLHGIGGQ